MQARSFFTGVLGPPRLRLREPLPTPPFGRASFARGSLSRPLSTPKGEPSAPCDPRRRSLGLIGVAVLALSVSACEREQPPGAEQPAEVPSAPAPVGQVGTPTIPSELAAQPAPPPSAAPTVTPAEAAPYTGPYFVVLDGSAGVYADTAVEKKGKLGYLRSGAKVPVNAGSTVRDNCKKGWLKLRDGGYVCAEAGTTNTNSTEARFAIRQPDWTKVLPYTYARNAKNGTPLYMSVPTVEQMNQYEPYLLAAKKKAQEEKDKAKATAVPASAPAPATEAAALPFTKEAMDQAARRQIAPATARVEAAPAGDSPARSPEVAPARLLAPDAGAAPDTRPWWQRDDADKRLHEVKLGELESDADGVLAKRMVKGFYVAVDKTFNWNNRLWYKTTKGLVAPADRFWTTTGSEFKGVELNDTLTLPVGFTHGLKKARPTYTLDPATNQLKPAGQVEHQTMVPLTGKEQEIGGKKYVETKAGPWMLASHLRVTHPGPPPADIGPTERWVDVDLETQTLVAFEGTRAVYATLISSGKESKIKDKDHRTPTGEFRVREKHVTTTMDGDGSAAGDLPYSIEDVPYVMYFHKAYALHGAFWHSNYGTQMSHGCVNLAPLDAKWVFLFTEPHLPEGWHGVWKSDARPGSRVVVH